MPLSPTPLPDSIIMRLNGKEGSAFKEAVRALSPLPLNYQYTIERTVTEVGYQRLAVVKSVMDVPGLVTPVPNWLSIPLLSWNKVSRAGNARRSMVPDARGESFRPDYGNDSIPLYCTFADFQIPIREMLQAERLGMPLDTELVSQSAININELIESQAINGADISFNGAPVYGLLNTPNRATDKLGNLSWASASKTGPQMLADVIRMNLTLDLNKQYGVRNIYVGTKVYSNLSNDYITGSAIGLLSIRNRLKQEVNDIVLADFLPDDYVVMVTMNRNVVDVLYGQEPTAITWSDGPGFNFKSIVLACSVVRFKDNYEALSGIVVGFPAA